jgi:hypothetical protein
MRNGFIALCFILLALPSAAQQKDFLTTREVEQVRQVQDPDQRLLLYLSFAQLRADQLEQLFGNNKAGRSVLIHDLLDQYTKIIEAMDTVVDDALRNRREIGLTLVSVIEGEEKLAARLDAWHAAAPKDLERYEFVLTTAIDTTRDSVAMNREDVGTRREEALAKEKVEKQDRRVMMTPETAKASEQTEKKEKEQRKPPTLFKKGEQKQISAPPPKK